LRYKKGDRVFWNDPDEGTCSGTGTVVVGGGGRETILLIKKDDGGSVECTANELTPLDKKTSDVIQRHAIPALRALAIKRCVRSNCGTVCLCDPCHARKALETLDPTWRP